MKDFLRTSAVIISIIIAALIVGGSLVRSAKIVSEGIKVKEVAKLDKIISELESIKKEIEKSAVARPAPREWKDERKMPEPPAAGAKRVEGVSAGTNPIKGNAKAPVLIVEFSDFQCPFSKKFYQQTFPQLEKEYISTGKVKFAFRDLPLDFHPMAKSAAIAARCAGKQNKYWEMFDKILTGGVFEKEAMKKYAQELGLNLKTFEECLEKPEIKSAVEADLADAGKFGAGGTPSFFINGRFISGAYPFEAFKKIIDEELAKPGKK